MAVLSSKLDEASRTKLERLENREVERFVAGAVDLCRPETVRVFDDSAEGREYTRLGALETGEEHPLEMQGHTVHFDGYFNAERHDQARDKKNTRYLLPPGESLGPGVESLDRETGLAEIREILAGSMAGKEMLVRFFCLGPVGSPFAIPCVQITDSAYVAHSEDILYRPGYEALRRSGGEGGIFRMLHAAGRLVNGVCADIERRRIYIDIPDNLVYSVNTQYAGNSVGLKKLALRLAIRKADREGWLAEHMFLMGVHGPGGRVTFFTGAYPSACGKTSTSMVQKETILGDDLVYIRILGGAARAVNVEKGVFGIIEDVNPLDDPELFRVLTSPGEVIFNNVLVCNGKPFWVGMGKEMPAAGINYAGPWCRGKCDACGREIAPSYRGNARFTVALEALRNLDPRADDPDGVPVGGIIYGGRDSDTAVPVQESFDWVHGIVTMGASLESETTAATIGDQGVRKCNPMAILDFLSIPLGRYVGNNLRFGAELPRPPRIFATNYWLKDDRGNFLNDKLDKAVWLKWMELRVHGEVAALDGPTGRIPRLDDLAQLFRRVLGKPYSREDYLAQFTIRVAGSLAKLERIGEFYRRVSDLPAEFWTALADQRERLAAWHARKGDFLNPFDLE
jgi:phosphoenolpyruvate carboxykinase (GTP)